MDGILYSGMIGGFLYLLTTTGIYRYIYNKEADKSDYGVFNRDISYVSYEIPSAHYTPAILGSNLAFINRNGMACILAMADGSLRKVPGWNFSLTNDSFVNIWGFINELGNNCFVIGDICIDVTYKDQDNIVGSISRVDVCGFIRFTLDDVSNYELIILSGEIGSALSKNFSQGALTFGAIKLYKDKYRDQFYVRKIVGKDQFEYQEKEIGIQLIIDYFHIVSIESDNFLLIPNNNVYNINVNDEINTDELLVDGKLLCLGFANITLSNPVIINQMVSMIKVPKITIPFPNIIISDFVKYLSLSDEKVVSNFFITTTVNGHTLEEQQCYKNEYEPDNFSASKFVEVTLSNASATSFKIDIVIEQRVLVQGMWSNIAITDSIYISPIQLVYSIYSSR